MRIAIVGAGIAGLAAARGLIGRGHEVQVLERSAALRTGGGALSLWSSGTGILGALGVDLAGAGQRLDVLDARRANGGGLARTDLAALGARFGSPSVCLPRATLLARLAAALPAGTIVFGQRVDSIEQRDGGVIVRTSDGTIEADVVLGADGGNSAVRRVLLGDAPARPNGWATWQGLSAVPIDLVAGRVGVTMVGREGYCGLIPAGDGLLQWWFEVRHDPAAPLPADPLGWLRERFGTWAAPVPEVLAAVTEVELFVHQLHDVPKTWGTGACSLLGDAAHAMPPSLAQGANQALEDAWVLTNALPADAPREQWPALLRGYEQARHRRAARIAKLAARATAQQDSPLQQFNRMPDRLITWMFGQIVARHSNFLADRRAVPVGSST